MKLSRGVKSFVGLNDGVVAQVRFLLPGHNEVAVFRDTFRGGMICFYRQNDAYWPILFNKLFKVLKTEENPKLFPIMGQRPWTPNQYIEDYRLVGLQ